MKHSDDHPLLNELLTGPETAEFREASLREALTVLRRTQQRRKVARGVALAALPVLLVSLIMLGWSRDASRTDPGATTPATVASVPEPSESSSVNYISDEELLALFPNQPLALVGPEGRQQLVFLDHAFAN